MRGVQKVHPAPVQQAGKYQVVPKTAARGGFYEETEVRGQRLQFLRVAGAGHQDDRSFAGQRGQMEDQIADIGPNPVVVQPPNVESDFHEPCACSGSMKGRLWGAPALSRCKDSS